MAITAFEFLPGEDVGPNGGGENGGDPGQGFPIIGPHRFELLLKLMGVNCEKEPLYGTGPDRKLFDKSKTFRPEIPVKDVGIEPDWLLLLSRLSLDRSIRRNTFNFQAVTDLANKPKHT